MNMRVWWTATTTAIAALTMVLVLSGCTSSSDSGEEAADAILATTASTQEATTSSSTSDDTSDEDTTTTGPGTLEDSTEDADETLPPPSSLVPGAEFCEPTRVTGQAIRFQPGAEQAILRSPAAPGQSDLYSVEVNTGQIMTVAITSENTDVVATLLPPDGVFIPGVFTETTVTETAAGNYWICVVSGDTSDQYELTVSVIDDNSPTKVDADWCGTDVNDRGEIKFAAGSTSGQVDNAVILGERDLYTLDAGADQQFSGELSAFEQNAAFQLRSPSGDIILDTETTTNTAGFSIQLPESGVYGLCIGSTRGNATYTLDLIIE